VRRGGGADTRGYGPLVDGGPSKTLLNPSASVGRPNLFTSGSVTVNPMQLNLAFRLDIPPAQYSYSLITSGLADGSIVVWNDAEATAQASEPGTWLLGMAGIAAIWARWHATRSVASADSTA
jgi:hypothetical protein